MGVGRVGGGAYLVAPLYEALGQLVDVVLHTPHIREEEIRHHAGKGRGQEVTDRKICVKEDMM